MPSLAAQYNGFPTKGLRFLKELTNNNERIWFTQRKAEYEAFVQQPFLELLEALETRLKKSRIPLVRNYKQPMFRIYRDIRFSNDKTPYKTSASAALYCNGEKMRPGLLYVQIQPDSSFVAAGAYQPDRDALSVLRTSIAEKPKAFMKVISDLDKSGLTLDLHDSLVRLPREFSQSEGQPYAPYLKLRSMVVRRTLTQKSLTTPQILDDLCDFTKAALPLLTFLWTL